MIRFVADVTYLGSVHWSVSGLTGSPAQPVSGRGDRTGLFSTLSPKQPYQQSSWHHPDPTLPRPDGEHGKKRQAAAAKFRVGIEFTIGFRLEHVRVRR